MKPPSHSDALASFLPWFHLDTLSSRKHALVEHRVELAAGVILFVDITGFSRITEQLSQAGPAGAEQLADILNAYFGQMTEIITGHGGDVLSFAGDAALGIWFAEFDDLGKSTCLAVQAGLAIQNEFESYQATPEVLLQQRVSVGAGRLCVSELGGFGGRWKYFVAGEALRQSGAANEHSLPGEVVIADSSWQFVQDRCQGIPTETGIVRLKAVVKPYALSPRQRPQTTEALAMLAGAYLPRVIQDRVDAGQADWLAEFRSVSLIFIGLGTLDFDEPETMVALQRAVEATQRIEQQYEGSILRFLMDDKGTTLIVSFGLPPLAHEDDASRAVRSALTLRKQLIDLGLRPSIGVTTGRAFCGACGMEARRQYSIYGPVINLAARLMQLADGRLICDTNTVVAAKKHAHLEFREHAAVPLKGFSENVVIFEPRETRVSKQHMESQATIVGRTEERALLRDAIADLVNDRAGRVVILEGEAGIGKSQLLQDAMSKARDATVSCFSTVADEIEKDTPLYAWRSVFLELLNVDISSKNQDANSQCVLDALAPWTELIPMASLLNLLLPFDIPEPSLVGAMSDEARAEKRQDILVTLLKDRSAQGPTLISVDNAQWLDSASWQLLEGLAQSAELLLVISIRPVDPLPPGYESMLALPDTAPIKLDSLAPEEVVALVCQCLGIQQVPDSVAKLVISKAGGHPFFSEELAYMLRDVGLIQISKGKCRLVAAEDEIGQELTQRLDDQDLPSTVQGVIMRRLDRLPPEQLLTVKVASAIGQRFSLSILRDVYPVEVDGERLVEDLAELIRLKIADVEPGTAEPVYRFKQTITLEVAYESMLFAQRRALHQSIAQWHERVHAAELTNFYPVLAHHWQRGENLPKAVDYLAKSGEQALGSFANQEAVRFYSDALKLDDRDEESVGRFERGAWELRLGRAFVNWSKYPEGREHLEKGLVLIGQAAPEGVATYFRLGSQIVRQVLYRSFSRRSPPQPDDEARLLDAARAYEALMEIYFTANATEKSLYAALRSLNLAEAAGPSSELARGYGAMGALMGIMGMRRSAYRYCDRAMNTAKATEDPATEAWVSLASGVYNAGQGNWDQAIALLQNVVDISEHLNDRRRWEDGSLHLAFAHYLQGDFLGSLPIAKGLYTSTLRGDDDRGRSFALLIRGYCLLRLNRLEEIPVLVEEMGAMRSNTTDEIQPLSHVLLAAFHWQQSETQAARIEAYRALNGLSTLSMSYESITDYSTLAGVYLNLLEGEAIDSNLVEQATKACRLMRNHARFFPAGRSGAALSEGLRLRHAGHHAKAHKLWSKSLEHAKACAMPYDEGCAHYQIGRHLERGDPDRATHLKQARRLFDQLGAEFDRACVENELGID